MITRPFLLNWKYTVAVKFSIYTPGILPNFFYIFIAKKVLPSLPRRILFHFIHYSLCLSFINSCLLRLLSYLLEIFPLLFSLLCLLYILLLILYLYFPWKSPWIWIINTSDYPLSKRPLWIGNGGLMQDKSHCNHLNFLL